MNNQFVVSARKYRPQLFSAIRGQEHVIKTLQNAIKNNQIANAFLFCGLKGSGKTTAARLLAKAINCDQTTPFGEPCNKCATCTKNAFFSIHELDAASHNSAEDMRQIVEQIRYHSPNGKKSITIIDEAHMLSNAALNVLLKPLEDTPDHVVFILVTTEKHKIIPTILSRCQVFDFHQIDPTHIKAQLQYVAQQEAINYEKEAVALISQKAGGSLRDALSMFDLVVTFSGDKRLTYEATLYHLNILDEDSYFKITEALYAGDVGSALLQYDTIIRTGIDFYQFVSGLGQHLRNLLVAQNTKTLPLMNLGIKDRATYQQKAKTINTEFLYEALSLAQDCELHYKNSLNQRLHVEMTLIKIGCINKVNQSTAYVPTKLRIPLMPKEGTVDKKHITISAVGKGAIKHQITYGKSIEKQATMLVSEPDISYKPHATQKQTIAIPNANAMKGRRDNKKPITDRDGSYQTNVLNEQEVVRCWQAYAKRMRETKNFSQYVILQQPMKLKENTITLSLTNPLQQNSIDELKPDLLTYLRQELHNANVTINTQLISQTDTKKTYSNSEKLIELTKQHSPIAYLKQKLGLVAN